MSYARSPRLVCSTTIGTKLFMYVSKWSAIATLLTIRRRNGAEFVTRRLARCGFGCVGLGHRKQFCRADLMLFDFGQLDNKVDDLVLENRRPQIGHGLRVLAK